MRSIGRVVELRLIGDLSAPGLAAAKSCRTAWLPKTEAGGFVIGHLKYHCRPPKWRRRGTMMIHWSRLPSWRRSQPSLCPLMSALIVPLAISPQYECVQANPALRRCSTELYEAPSGEPIQVEFQAVLQANPLAWSWHLTFSHRRATPYGKLYVCPRLIPRPPVERASRYQSKAP